MSSSSKRFWACLSTGYKLARFHGYYGQKWPDTGTCTNCLLYFVCEVPQTEIFIHYLRRKLKESIAKEENVQLLERRNRKLLGPQGWLRKRFHCSRAFGETLPKRIPSCMSNQRSSLNILHGFLQIQPTIVKQSFPYSMGAPLKLWTVVAT